MLPFDDYVTRCVQVNAFARLLARPLVAFKDIESMRGLNQPTMTTIAFIQMPNNNFAAEIYFLVVIALHGNTQHTAHSAQLTKCHFSLKRCDTRKTFCIFYHSIIFHAIDSYIIVLCIAFVPFANPNRRSRREKHIKLTSSRRQLFIMCLSWIKSLPNTMPKKSTTCEKSRRIKTNATHKFVSMSLVPFLLHAPWRCALHTFEFELNIFIEMALGVFSTLSVLVW